MHYNSIGRANVSNWKDSNKTLCVFAQSHTSTIFIINEVYILFSSKIDCLFNIVTTKIKLY